MKHGNILWTTKYRPTQYSELISDENINRQLLAWACRWKEFCARKSSEWPGIVLLSGRPGVGKSVLARQICNVAEFNYTEIRADDERSAKEIVCTLKEVLAVKTTLKNKRPNMLVLDDIEALLSVNIGREICEFVLKLSVAGKEQATSPVLCICNDMYVHGLQRLRKQLTCFVLPPPNTFSLAARLHEICGFERLDGLLENTSQLSQLCRVFDGDIRACIGFLEVATAGVCGFERKIGLPEAHTRQKGVFDALEKILTKRESTRQSCVAQISRCFDEVSSPDSLLDCCFGNYLGGMREGTSMEKICHTLELCSVHEQASRQHGVHGYACLAAASYHLCFAAAEPRKFNIDSHHIVAAQQRQNRELSCQWMKRTGFLEVGSSMEMLDCLCVVLFPALHGGSFLSPTEKKGVSEAAQTMKHYRLGYSRKESGMEVSPPVDRLCIGFTLKKESAVHVSALLNSTEQRERPLKRTESHAKTVYRHVGETTCAKKRVKLAELFRGI